jgi:hypothetical protein
MDRFNQYRRKIPQMDFHKKSIFIMGSIDASLLSTLRYTTRREARYPHLCQRIHRTGVYFATPYCEKSGMNV